ncbi:hypothetical protein T08_13555 [Trichinella sp. T8]|nr:hypothetical protein T08_13555 [Trichinella sp. T8]
MINGETISFIQYSDIISRVNRCVTLARQLLVYNGNKKDPLPCGHIGAPYFKQCWNETLN